MTRPILGRMSAELDQSCLFWVEIQCELSESFSQIIQEAFRILSVLEADNAIIAITHDDHVAGCMALAPLLDPKIVDVVQIGVGEQW